DWSSDVCSSDLALHVVGVAGSVDVRVVALVGLVLDVRDVDRDAALLLLRRVVDRVEVTGLIEVRELVVQDLRDRSAQRGLAVVDVTDGADVDVRLGPLELSPHRYPSNIHRTRRRFRSDSLATPMR